MSRSDERVADAAAHECQERVRASFNRQGLMAHLGALLAHVGPGSVRIEVPFRAELTQQHGWFHGGVIGAVADSAGGYAALSVIPPGSEVLTVEYKINFLAAAAGTQLEATGLVIRAGRTLTVTQLDVHAIDGAHRIHVAHGQQTLMAVPVT